MKNLLKIFLLTGVLFACSCNKDDDNDAPAVNPNLLATPATMENANAMNIPDAIAGIGSCGSGTSATPIASEIVIEKEGTIADPSKVSIELQLTHTWCGDIVAELIAPDGNVCALIKRMASTTDTSCGDNSNFSSENVLTFNAAFETAIDPVPLSDNDLIPAGNYAPSVTVSVFPEAATVISLQDFLNGKSIKGTWKLRITDCGVGDTGSLFKWKLKFDSGSVQ